MCFEHYSRVSGLNYRHLQSVLQGSGQDDDAGGFAEAHMMDVSTTSRNLVIDQNEFFDPPFNYDFTHLKDTETYFRGGEVYERPCGWQRFGLKASMLLISFQLIYETSLAHYQQLLQTKQRPLLEVPKTAVPATATSG